MQMNPYSIQQKKAYDDRIWVYFSGFITILLNVGLIIFHLFTLKRLIDDDWDITLVDILVFGLGFALAFWIIANEFFFISCAIKKIIRIQKSTATYIYISLFVVVLFDLAIVGLAVFVFITGSQDFRNIVQLSLIAFAFCMIVHGVAYTFSIFAFRKIVRVISSEEKSERKGYIIVNLQ